MDFTVLKNLTWPWVLYTKEKKKGICLRDVVSRWKRRDQKGPGLLLGEFSFIQKRTGKLREVFQTERNEVCLPKLETTYVFTTPFEHLSVRPEIGLLSLSLLVPSGANLKTVRGIYKDYMKGETSWNSICKKTSGGYKRSTSRFDPCFEGTDPLEMFIYRRRFFS